MQKISKIVSLALVFSLILSATAFASKTTETTKNERENAIVNDYKEIGKKDFDKKVMIKIPSNAHKFDAAGMMFEWVPKQADDGYLKVTEDVFQVYESFNIYVKCSNTYMYKTITEPGTYLIEQFEANKKVHNINMVWIGDFQLKKGIGNEYFLKVISNYQEYENGEGVGRTEFEVADLTDAMNFIISNKGYAVEPSTGQFARDVWSSIWEKDPILQALFPQYVWNSYEVTNPVDGDIVKLTTPFFVKGDEITAVSELKIAADNAYFVFVNGNYVGCSSFLEGKYNVDYEDANLIRQIYGPLSLEFVPDDSWREIGTYDISSYINVGNNVITVYAANEYFDQDDYVENGDPHHMPGNTQNNPAAMVFGFTVVSKD